MMGKAKERAEDDQRLGKYESLLDLGRQKQAAEEKARFEALEAVRIREEQLNLGLGAALFFFLELPFFLKFGHAVPR